MDHLENIKDRIRKLELSGFLSIRDATDFILLEEYFSTETDKSDWLDAFHKSNDNYMKLLEKVLKALVKYQEPHSQEKLNIFYEEKGTMGPAVFLTPWELTLTDLDREFLN